MIGDHAVVPDYPKTETGQLSVSAWVWAHGLDPWATIVQNWWAPPAATKPAGQFYLGVNGQSGLWAAVGQQNGRKRISKKATERGSSRKAAGSTWRWWPTARSFASTATASKSA